MKLLPVPIAYRYTVLFEGPVPNKNANESVATSYISERKDYSNSEGRRLLAHIWVENEIGNNFSSGV